MPVNLVTTAAGVVIWYYGKPWTLQSKNSGLNADFFTS